MCLKRFEELPTNGYGWKVFSKKKVKEKERLTATWAFRPGRPGGCTPGAHTDQYPLKIYSQNHWNAADFRDKERGIHVFLEYQGAQKESRRNHNSTIRRVKLGKVLATGFTLREAKAAVVDSVYIYDKRQGDEHSGPLGKEIQNDLS